MVTNAVRRIALGELTASGRFYADLDELTADGRQAPLAPAPASSRRRPARTPGADAAAGHRRPTPRGDPLHRRLRELGAVRRQHAAVALRGDRRTSIRAWLDPARTTSLLDFRDRAALLALGAALEAAEIGARALGFEPVRGNVRRRAGVGARARSATGARDEEAAEILWQRCCNRRTGASRPVPDAELAPLARARRAARRARRRPATRSRELGTALGTLDRVRFLSPRLRRDMMGELRFTAEEAHATRDGIEVASLELDGADRAAMDVLRTGAGMDFLAQLDRGWGLGNVARDAFAGSAGALVLRAAAVDRAALVDAGRGLMRLWLEATRRDLAIHPWGSPFLFQHLLEDGDSLEGWERTRADPARPARSRPWPPRPRAPDPADPADLAQRPAVGALAAPPGSTTCSLRVVRRSRSRTPSRRRPGSRAGSRISRSASR